MENITKKSSDREMKTMFDMTDSENESDTSMAPESVEDIPSNNHVLPHPPPAAAASFLDKKGHVGAARAEFETMALCSETCYTYACNR
eukprot:694203-Pyramimonas_sp.AAC.1